MCKISSNSFLSNPLNRQRDTSLAEVTTERQGWNRECENNLRWCEHPYRHRGSTRSRSKKSWSLFTEEISIGNWESVKESSVSYRVTVAVWDMWHCCHCKHLSSATLGSQIFRPQNSLNTPQCQRQNESSLLFRRLCTCCRQHVHPRVAIESQRPATITWHYCCILRAPS